MIRIISVHLNDPLFIYYQKKLLDKFISSDFEFVVFDDSGNSRNLFSKGTDDFNSNVKSEIIRICEVLGVKRIEIPSDIHLNPGTIHRNRDFIVDHPAEWCSNSLQYAINYCKEIYTDSDLILNIDSDMFPILPIDLKKYMSGFDLSGVPQFRKSDLSDLTIEYIWNGIFCFNPKNINWDLFNWDTCDISESEELAPRFSGIHTDVGGMMFFYLKKHPEYKKIIHLPSCTWNNLDVSKIEKFIKDIKNPIFNFLEKDPRNVNGKYFSEFYPPGFLHYRSGGNWDNYSIHRNRKKIFFDYFDKILNSK